MGRDRLIHLALLCTERAYANKVDFPTSFGDLCWILWNKWISELYECQKKS